MRVRHSASAASSLLAALILLLALGTAVDCHLSAIWRVAVASIDDPAGQERAEAAPANVPIEHRGGEAVAHIAVAFTTVGRLTPITEPAISPCVSVVSVPRAPPAA